MEDNKVEGSRRVFVAQLTTIDRRLTDTERTDTDALKTRHARDHRYPLNMPNTAFYYPDKRNKTSNFN